MILVLAAAISWVFAGRGLPASDEGAVLTRAAALLHGGVYYRDVDAYELPGAAYLLALAMRWLGEDLAVARGLAAAVFCGIVAALYACALRLLDRRRAALFALALLCLKVVARPAFTAYLYPDLALLWASLAILLLLGPRRDWRLGLAGLCGGLAVLAKQTLGGPLLLAAAALLLWPGPLTGAPAGDRRWRRLTLLGAGAAAALAPLLVHFGAEGVLGRMAEAVFVRPFASYLPTSSISFGVPLDPTGLGALRGMPGFPYLPGPLWTLLMRHELPGEAAYPVYWMAGELFTRLLYASLVLAFLGAGLRRLRRRRAPTPAAEQRRFAFAWLAFAVTLSAFPRADFFHVASVYPVVLLVLFGLGEPAEADAAPARRSAARLAEALGVALLWLACGTLAWIYHGQMSQRLRLARAELWVHPEQAWIGPLVEYVRSRVAPDQRLFVDGHEAYYYFFSDRSSPWPFPQLYPGQTGRGDGSDVVEALRADPPALVIRGVQSWPGVPALADYAPALGAWIDAHYEPDPDFPDPRVLGSHPAPPVWVVQVLRPKREAPPQQPGDQSM